MKHFIVFRERLSERINALSDPLSGSEIHSLVESVFDTIQCSALKRNGDRCGMMAREENLCRVHLKKKNAVKCRALLKSGKSKGQTCSLYTLESSDFCKRHQGSVAIVEDDQSVQDIDGDQHNDQSVQDIDSKHNDQSVQDIDGDQHNDQSVQDIGGDQHNDQSVQDIDSKHDDQSVQDIDGDQHNDQSVQDIDGDQHNDQSVQDIDGDQHDDQSVQDIGDRKDFTEISEKVPDQKNVPNKVPIDDPLERHLLAFERRLKPFENLPYFDRDVAILIEKDLWKLRQDPIRRGYEAKELLENDRIIDSSIDLIWRERASACIYFNPKSTIRDMCDGMLPLCAKRLPVDGFYCAEHVNKKTNTELYPWLMTSDSFDPLKIWTPRIHNIIDGNGLWHYENYGLGAKATKKGFIAISNLVMQGRFYQEMTDYDILKCHNAGLLYKQLEPQRVHELYEIPHDLEPLEGKGFTSFEQLLVERPQLYIKYWNIWNSRVQEVQNYKKVYGKLDNLQLFKKIRCDTIPDWVQFEEDFRTKGLNHNLIPPPTLEQASDPTFHPLLYCWTWAQKKKNLKVFVEPPYYIEYPLPTQEEHFVENHPDNSRVRLSMHPWMTFHYDWSVAEWKQRMDKFKEKKVHDNAFYLAIRSPNKYWLEHYDPKLQEAKSNEELEKR